MMQPLQKLIYKVALETRGVILLGSAVCLQSVGGGPPSQRTPIAKGRHRKGPPSQKAEYNNTFSLQQNFFVISYLN